MEITVLEVRFNGNLVDAVGIVDSFTEVQLEYENYPYFEGEARFAPSINGYTVAEVQVEYNR